MNIYDLTDKLIRISAQIEMLQTGEQEISELEKQLAKAKTDAEKQLINNQIKEVYATNAEDREEYLRLLAEQDAICSTAEKKIEWRLNVLAESKANAEAVAERARRIAKKKKTADNIVDYWESDITMHLKIFGINKVKTTEFSASLGYAGSGSVILPEDIDLRTLPDSCYKIIPESVEPVKNEIAKAIKTSGAQEEEINGQKITLWESGIMLIKKLTLRVS